MAYQFQAGQLVRLCRSIRHNGAEGYYEVIRRLPDEDGEQRYRIKSRSEPHERVAKKSDLEHASAEF
jgi:hypothetical protein